MSKSNSAQAPAGSSLAFLLKEQDLEVPIEEACDMLESFAELFNAFAMASVAADGDWSLRERTWNEFRAWVAKMIIGLREVQGSVRRMPGYVLVADAQADELEASRLWKMRKAATAQAETLSAPARVSQLS